LGLGIFSLEESVAKSLTPRSTPMVSIDIGNGKTSVSHRMLMKYLPVGVLHQTRSFFRLGSWAEQAL